MLKKVINTVIYIISLGLAITGTLTGNIYFYIPIIPIILINELFWRIKEDYFE